MDIIRIRALRGPNLWTRSTAIEAVVQCPPEEADLAQLPGFEDRLRARFPAIGALQPHGSEQTLSLAPVLQVAALRIAGHRGDRRPFRTVFGLVLAYHPYRPFSHFRGILRVCHCSILSRVGASDKPGAVHDRVSHTGFREIRLSWRLFARYPPAFPNCGRSDPVIASNRLRAIHKFDSANSVTTCA